MQFELDIIKALQSGASDGLTIFFKIISLLGSWYGFIILLFVFFFFAKKFALCFGVTFLGGITFNYILKLLIDRPRPFEISSEILALTDAMGRSMPSNHAFCATVLTIFLCYFILLFTQKKWVKGLVISCGTVFVLLVGLSRMYLGVHYLTDIVAGVMIGVCVSFIGIMLYQRWVRKSFYGNNIR